MHMDGTLVSLMDALLPHLDATTLQRVATAGHREARGEALWETRCREELGIASGSLTEAEFAALSTLVHSWRKLYAQCAPLRPTWNEEGTRRTTRAFRPRLRMPETLAQEHRLDDWLFIEVFYLDEHTLDALPAAARRFCAFDVEQAAMHFPGDTRLPVDVEWVEPQFLDDMVMVGVRVCAQLDGRMVLICDTLEADYEEGSHDLAGPGEYIYNLVLPHAAFCHATIRFDVARSDADTRVLTIREIRMDVQDVEYEEAENDVRTPWLQAGGVGFRVVFGELYHSAPRCKLCLQPCFCEEAEARAAMLAPVPADTSADSLCGASVSVKRDRSCDACWRCEECYELAHPRCMSLYSTGIMVGAQEYWRRVRTPWFERPQSEAAAEKLSSSSDGDLIAEISTSTDSPRSQRRSGAAEADDAESSDAEDGAARAHLAAEVQLQWRDDEPLDAETLALYNDAAAARTELVHEDSTGVMRCPSCGKAYDADLRFFEDRRTGELLRIRYHVDGRRGRGGHGLHVIENSDGPRDEQAGNCQYVCGTPII